MKHNPQRNRGQTTGHHPLPIWFLVSVLMVIMLVELFEPTTINEMAFVGVVVVFSSGGMLGLIVGLSNRYTDTETVSHD